MEEDVKPPPMEMENASVPVTTWAIDANIQVPAALHPAATVASAALFPMATRLISAACAAWVSQTGYA